LRLPLSTDEENARRAGNSGGPAMSMSHKLAWAMTHDGREAAMKFSAVIVGLTLFTLGTASPANGESYLYSGGSYSTLSVPGAGITNAFGINNLGQVVGGYCLTACGVSQGFIYSNGSYATFNVPGSTSTRLTGSTPMTFRPAGRGLHNAADHDLRPEK
jgi:probable HAF family extracellular repeat protein